MRGGSLPLLAWGALLAVLMVICWIWTGDAIQVATFGFAVAVVWGSAVLLAAAGRGEPLRRGPPPPDPTPHPVSTASMGSLLVAVAVASIVFGFAFGKFMIFFGIGLLILALGLLARDRAEERRIRRALAADPTSQDGGACR
jgi:hypothetical protein